MFEYLRGKVIEKKDNLILLDVGGLGFRIFVPERDSSSVAIGEEAVFYVYLNYKSDKLELFGFLSREDRDLFERLLSVAKIGTRVSFEILNRLSAKEFFRILERDDVSALSSIPRVGEKRAKRVVFELKGELLRNRGSFADVREALLNLGYNDREVSFAISKLLETGIESENVEELIKKALIILRGDV